MTHHTHYMNEEVEQLVMAALTRLQKNSDILNEAVKETNKERHIKAWRDGIYETCNQLQLALSQNAMYKRNAARYTDISPATKEFKDINKHH